MTPHLDPLKFYEKNSVLVEPDFPLKKGRSFLVRSWLLIALIEYLIGHKSLGVGM